jgi:hypothetical protein
MSIAKPTSGRTDAVRSLADSICRVVPFRSRFARHSLSGINVSS